MSKDTGGPAFPYEFKYGDGTAKRAEGMTLRDYFAAKALSVVPEQTAYNMKLNENEVDYIVRRAHEIADAMLKAREA